MKIAHLLRKYNPDEWGGTETAVQRLLDGLGHFQTHCLVYAPRLAAEPLSDPLRAAGHQVVRYSAFLPVARLSPEKRGQLVGIGGNLMSFDLPWKLFREPGLSVIHTHALNRIGGIGLRVAQLRKLPLVATIHGGVLDLPEQVKAKLAEPMQGGFEWGKIFGPLLASRKLLDQADAIITCNRKEAALLQQKFPGKTVLSLPHPVPVERFEEDHRQKAFKEFPVLQGRPYLLALGRIDPVKNQLWAIQQLPLLLKKHPGLLLVLAGPCTDEAYGKLLKKEVRHAGLEEHVLMTGGLPENSASLTGLLQGAKAVVVPSLSETFGLVIIEAWAAGTPVLSTRTSGALDLVEDGENGVFFELENPAQFQERALKILSDPEVCRTLARGGSIKVRSHYDARQVAGRVHQLYQELCQRRSTR
jgi:alpha-maltose-1-phosphate synthase